MGSNKHDVVVIGAGHNGLIVAAYLAKAGLDVCVVECQDQVGGSAVTREEIPGFRFDMGAKLHYGLVWNPLIHRDELGLISKYGLKYLFPDPIFSFVFPDRSALTLYQDISKTCESIAQFSKRDAEAYIDFCKTSLQLLGAPSIAALDPPPAMGRIVSFLDATEVGRQYWRVLLSSAVDVAQEWFESEQMKAAVCRWAAEIMMSPREIGTGLYASSGLPYLQYVGIAMPEGGASAPCQALAAFIRDSGGSIRLSTQVKGIEVEASEAKGIILDDGERIMADRAIVSNVNVKQLFLEMIKPEDLPTGFQEQVRLLKHSQFSFMHCLLALNEPPKYRAGGDLNRTVCVAITPLLEEFLRTLDDCIYGIPKARAPLFTVHTLADPSRAPDGKHTLSLLHHMPYSLKEDGSTKWDEIKQDMADSILESARLHATNLERENIIGRKAISPLDFERYNPAMVHGDILHIGVFPSQFLSNRPLAGWGRYRTPLKKLYMCGASTHPGGGITGGGRSSVQAVMEDLDIDFQKVIAA